jgi:hypothetical protein
MKSMSDERWNQLWESNEGTVQPSEVQRELLLALKNEGGRADGLEMELNAIRYAMQHQYEVIRDTLLDDFVI